MSEFDAGGRNRMAIGTAPWLASRLRKRNGHWRKAADSILHRVVPLRRTESSGVVRSQAPRQKAAAMQSPKNKLRAWGWTLHSAPKQELPLPSENKTVLSHNEFARANPFGDRHEGQPSIASRTLPNFFSGETRPEFTENQSANGRITLAGKMGVE